MKLALPARLGLAVLLLAGVIFPAGCKEKPKPSAQAPPPPPVTVVPAEARSVPHLGNYVGSTQAVQEVTVRARVKGYLVKQAFTDGADVKKDDLLFEIDPRQYQYQVDQLNAKLAQADAQIKQYKDQVKAAQATVKAKQAVVDLTQEIFDEYAKLQTSGAASRQEYFNSKERMMSAKADYQQALADALVPQEMLQARIGEEYAVIEEVKAELETARLNLSWCTITAPLGGRIGRRQVDVGNLVGNDGDTALATIVQLDPIYVLFSPPQRDLPAIRRELAAGTLAVTVYLAGQKDNACTGTVDFVDNTVNATTSTILMRATVKNPDKTLLPGQYVTVTMQLGTWADAIVIPARAIQQGQGGSYVYVVGPDNKAAMAEVDDGPMHGKDMQVIFSGLKAGQKVIVDGLQKVRPGQPVQPSPPKAAPTQPSTKRAAGS
jgi:RND family efflux transporter MFP subunit